jgi:N-acetylglucosamine kinase-like BadF-type ATPase
MKFIIGLDGGGTKTNCIFADESGKSVLEISGGPSNFLSIGNEKAASNIMSLIKSGLSNLDSPIENVSIILAGISGAGRKLHADQLKESLLKKLPESLNNIFIESDARVALEGALASEPGAILIAGTGSIIFGKDEPGNIHRVGGFGRIAGDEGSGYSIGVKTLRLISQMIDGREKAGKILEKFKRIFHIKNEDDLITLIHNPGFDVASIAMFAIKSADEGIGEAAKILDEEADELIKHILVIKDKLKLSPLKLVLIGSLIENENYYSRLLTEKITAIKNIALSKRKYSPEMGAVIMASKILASKKIFPVTGPDD